MNESEQQVYYRQIGLIMHLYPWLDEHAAFEHYQQATPEQRANLDRAVYFIELFRHPAGYGGNLDRARIH